jgi:hypothetical protein
VVDRVVRYKAAVGEILLGIALLLLAYATPWDIVPKGFAAVLGLVLLALAVWTLSRSEGDQPDPSSPNAASADRGGIAVSGKGNIVTVHAIADPSPTSNQDAEHSAVMKRRATILGRLRNEYVLSHDGISPALMAGLEDPPRDWVNRRLAELGETWRMESPPGPPSVSAKAGVATGTGNAYAPSPAPSGLEVQISRAPSSAGIDEVNWKTAGARERHIRLDFEPRALRFFSPTDQTVEALPSTVQVGEGWVIVTRFFDKGFMIDEIGTVGDVVRVQPYRARK